MSIGTRIRDRRKELGMSADTLADKIGKNRATIFRYETGDIENLPIDTLEPIAKALGVKPSYLMGWDEEIETEITKAEDVMRLIAEKFGEAEADIFGMYICLSKEMREVINKKIKTAYELELGD